MTKKSNPTTSIGPFIKCPHPEMIETIAGTKFDFAVIDMEHTPLSARDLYPLKLAAEARNLDLIVRIPTNAEEYFKWCLDLGFKYIQVPFVQTKEDALKAAKYSFFYPGGERGLCRFVRASQFSHQDKNEYISTQKNKAKLILQIEGLVGFNNLKHIIDVPGIYAIFIGPYDLSQSLGLPGDIWNPKVIEKMNSIITLCKSNNIKVGLFTDTPDGIEKWKSQGVDFIEYASDLNILISQVNSLFSAITKTS